MLTFLAPADVCFFAQVSAHVYNGELFLPAHLPGSSVPAGPGRAPPGQAAHEAGAQLRAGEHLVLSSHCSVCPFPSMAEQPWAAHTGTFLCHCTQLGRERVNDGMKLTCYTL